jgi:hypothetical protein
MSPRGTRQSYGASLSGKLGVGRADRFDRQPKAGLYRTKASGAGEYGGTAYPSIIESYNRDSELKRWRLGQELFFGTGRNWASLQLFAISRLLISPGPGDPNLDGSRDIVTLFPSTSSPEGVWYCSTRVRGSVIFPAPLDGAHITLDTSGDEFSEHRLIYDCSSFYTAGQVEAFRRFIGDQFEDTASGPNYPDDLVERPAGSVALTLVDIDPVNQLLIFDLSRPCVRVARDRRLYWQRGEYRPDRQQPVLVFDTGSGRHLCSSFKFFCCCPDHFGALIANTDRLGGGLQDRFPMPSSGRRIDTEWERDGGGYFRQWRPLPVRRDDRRDCKHIHAMRWECGVPWLEPTDYPTQEARDRFDAAISVEEKANPDEVLLYISRSQASWNRYILTLADTAGLMVVPSEDVRDNLRSDPRPIVWNDGRRPQPDWCRQNDWWVRRGSSSLEVFDEVAQEFRTAVTWAGLDCQPVTIVEAGDPGAPMIVR